MGLSVLAGSDSARAWSKKKRWPDLNQLPRGPTGELALSEPFPWARSAPELSALAGSTRDATV